MCYSNSGMFGSRGFAAPVFVGAVAGACLGVGLYTFGYAKGSAYLTNDPHACANCHVMRAQYESWMKSSHGKVAVCNDCHTPPGFAAKYATKAVNGFFHSLAFTSGHFPDEIRITPRNFAVTESACLKCHAEIVEGIRATHRGREEVSCIRCHVSVGHM